MDISFLLKGRSEFLKILQIVLCEVLLCLWLNFCGQVMGVKVLDDMRIGRFNVFAHYKIY